MLRKERLLGVEIYSASDFDDYMKTQSKLGYTIIRAGINKIRIRTIDKVIESKNTECGRFTLMQEIQSELYIPCLQEIVAKFVTFQYTCEMHATRVLEWSQVVFVINGTSYT